jgi:carboxypeptidase C (cathepsin A)
MHRLPPPAALAPGEVSAVINARNPYRWGQDAQAMTDTDPKDEPAAPKRDHEPRAPKPDHEPPPGAEASATWSGAGVSINYTVSANWTVLRKDDQPVAEIFSVSYLADADGGADARPLTFIFNGGPGASSAYLQMGVVGPTRVAFPPDGTLPAMPPRLVENEESWLAFTDLVFVDPVGTGFSRVIDPDAGAAKDSAEKQGRENPGETDRAREFFGYKRDLESLCEFVGRWLSRTRRWGSPVFVAGESYGGYRVGRLVRMLQETAGVGLSGAILISPALELGALSPGDYDALGWIDTLPTMALAAVHHGRSRAFAAGTAAEGVQRETEAFATGDYASFLARGASVPASERERILARLADLIGLPVELVTRVEGRISITRFVRELLRDERRVLGLYDATITTVDPFPDRERFEGADPTLAGFAPAFSTAINRQLRREIGVETDREYIVLSYEVFQAWRNDAPEHFFVPPVGATDDLRYGMSLNPHMKAFITHGRYDLVTPYYATDRLRNLMRLDPQVADRLTVRHFDGGHMFYAWERSRRAFTEAIAAFVADALVRG